MRLAHSGLLVLAAAVLGCASFSSEPVPPDGGAAGDAGDARDAGDPGRDAAAAPDAATPYRLVFLSNAELGPTTGFADAAAHYCTTEGQKQKPGGRFVPWLSISGDAAQALSGAGGWALSDGTPVFADAASLTKGMLLHVIDSGAEGGPRSPTMKAWTGTNKDGLQKTTDPMKNCQGFSSGNGALTGTIGLPAGFTDGRWTDQGEAACDTQAAVICFEL